MEKTLEFNESEIRSITVISSDNLTIAYAVDLNVVHSKELADFWKNCKYRLHSCAS